MLLAFVRAGSLRAGHVTRPIHGPSPAGDRAGARSWIFAPAKTSGRYKIRGPAFVGAGHARPAVLDEIGELKALLN